MNGRPKDFRALALTVQYCTHPDLDGIDIAILHCFAAYAIVDGTGSHPGNVNLCAASRLGRSAMAARVAKMVKLGLLALTNRGDGRGQSSEYRICLENTHFPERAPGGSNECLVEKPSGQEPDGLDETDSKELSGIPNKPSGYEPDSLPPQAPKPSGLEQKPSGLGRNTTTTQRGNPKNSSNDFFISTHTPCLNTPPVCDDPLLRLITEQWNARTTDPDVIEFSKDYLTRQSRQPIRNRSAYFSKALRPFLQNDIWNATLDLLTVHTASYVDASGHEAISKTELLVNMNLVLDEHGLPVSPNDYQTAGLRIIEAVMADRPNYRRSECGYWLPREYERYPASAYWYKRRDLVLDAIAAPQPDWPFRLPLYTLMSRN